MKKNDEIELELDRLNRVRNAILGWKDFERGPDPIGVAHAAGYTSGVRDCFKVIDEIVNDSTERDSRFGGPQSTGDGK